MHEYEINTESKPGQIRIGIDVGGTFTHAVAIDGSTLTLIGKCKVPTTHKAREGVALGIVQSLSELLEQSNIHADQVTFIAHSTTQATNALLEGDVAPVGIVGMGSGKSAIFAKQATRLGRIELAPSKFLTTYHRFLSSTQPPSDDAIKKAIDELVAEGAKVIAASEAFSVDGGDNEGRVEAIAQSMGLPACAGASVSKLYGLRVRTRTAAINASMLPKMLDSANMTEESVRKAGITAPLMVMRSDGGVMDIDAMRKKPILTMLSGPAAGVAAAMMYLHLSDGIFLEVGGTSTDISAIRDGKALVKSGEIGGHRIYTRTLDVRTLGVAGGSMVRAHNGQIVDVGPRSAHIAGLQYASFVENLEQPKIHSISPLPGDPKDYIAISSAEQDAATVTVTPTCAANLLGFVPKGDCAEGNQDTLGSALNCLGSTLHKSKEEVAKQILSHASEKCTPVVKALMKEYKLDEHIASLVGGGGGAAAIVPFLSQSLGIKHSLAEHADVISAIGVALALVRESVERQIINPTNDDILKLREDAFAAVQNMGADPSTIEVQVEVDSRTNTVRATGFGATSMSKEMIESRQLSTEEKLALVAESMRVSKDAVRSPAETRFFQAFQTSWSDAKFMGLIKTQRNALRIVDAKGAIRLQTQDGEARLCTSSTAESTIRDLAEKHALWGDAGKEIPNIILLSGPKIIDLSGLASVDQITALAKTELDGLKSDSEVIVLAKTW